MVTKTKLIMKVTWNVHTQQQWTTQTNKHIYTFMTIINLHTVLLVSM